MTEQQSSDTEKKTVADPVTGDTPNASETLELNSTDSQAGEELATQQKKGGKGALLLALLAFLLALVALLGVYYIWGLMGQQVTEQQRAVSTAQQSVRALESGLAKTQSRLGEQKQHLQSLEGSLAELQVVSTQGRVGLQKAEVMYLLRLANQIMQLSGDIPTTVKALELADQGLMKLADPRLLKVRRAIGKDLVALKAQPTMDLVGISLKLGGLSDQIETWPLLRGSLPDRSRLDKEPVPLADRAPLDTVVGQLKGLIEIRRNDRPVETLLPPEQSYFQRLNLALMFESARLALLQGKLEVYQQQIEASVKWIKRYFVLENSRVQAGITQLEQLLTGVSTIDLPDINEALILLYALEQAEEQER